MLNIIIFCGQELCNRGGGANWGGGRPGGKAGALAYHDRGDQQVTIQNSTTKKLAVSYLLSKTLQFFIPYEIYQKLSSLLSSTKNLAVSYLLPKT